MAKPDDTTADLHILGYGDESIQRMIDYAGIGLYVNGADGLYRFINQPLVEMLGFEDREAFAKTGLRAEDFYVNPKDLLTFRNRIEETGAVKGFLFQARRHDGSTLWLSEHGTAVRKPDGTVDRYVGSLIDVTEFVETQGKLAEAQGDYRRFLDHAQEGIYRTSLDGRQLMANLALVRLNGYETEQEQLDAITDIGREWYVDPGRRNEFQRLLAEHGAIENFESEIYTHKTRKKIWVSENAYVVRDENGAPLYYEGTVREITQKKEAERTLRDALRSAEQADSAKARFLAHMSHELRTPLNAILGFSDIIRNTAEQGATPDKIVEYAEDIHQSGAHLLELINDVLDLSRIESQAMPVELEPVDTIRAIESGFNFIQPMAKQKNITLSIGGDTTAPLMADSRRLHQCLLNLLSNAVKFSHPDRPVTVNVTEAGGMISIAVVDQGIGIPKSMLNEIGKPFVTVDDPTITAPKGTGLGLTITRSLIDLMDGELSIVSVMSEGTTVTITLPKADL